MSEGFFFSLAAGRNFPSRLHTISNEGNPTSPPLETPYTTVTCYTFVAPGRIEKRLGRRYSFCVGEETEAAGGCWLLRLLSAGERERHRGRHASWRLGPNHLNQPPSCVLLGCQGRKVTSRTLARRKKMTGGPWARLWRSITISSLVILAVTLHLSKFTCVLFGLIFGRSSWSVFRRPPPPPATVAMVTGGGGVVLVV